MDINGNRKHKHAANRQIVVNEQNIALYNIFFFFSFAWIISVN